MQYYSFKDIVLAENDDFILSSDPSGNILYQEQLKGHSLSIFEVKEILRALSAHRFRFYIIKVNNGKLLPPEDQTWVERLNLKRLLNAGISNVAYISPLNVFNSLELEREVEPGKNFRIKIFKDIKDAIHWWEKIIKEELTSSKSES